MSQAQDRNMSVHDLVHVGFTAVCFNADDLSKLPPRIQNEVRDSRIAALEEFERPLAQIEFGDRHPFGRKQYEELTKLRAERDAANASAATTTQPTNTSPVGTGVQINLQGTQTSFTGTGNK